MPSTQDASRRGDLTFARPSLTAPPRVAHSRARSAPGNGADSPTRKCRTETPLLRRTIVNERPHDVSPKPANLILLSTTPWKHRLALSGLDGLLVSLDASDLAVAAITVRTRSKSDSLHLALMLPHLGEL
jgi:hypothetical protein